MTDRIRIVEAIVASPNGIDAYRFEAGQEFDVEDESNRRQHPEPWISPVLADQLVDQLCVATRHLDTPEPEPVIEPVEDSAPATDESEAGEHVETPEASAPPVETKPAPKRQRK